MPFEQARELLQDLVGMQVSKATERRVTLATGEAALAHLLYGSGQKNRG